MKELKAHWGKWRSETLRNRFTRGGWGGRALFAAAPWINLLLLLALFWLVGNRVLVRPGVVFDLPRAPFREGMLDGLKIYMVPTIRTNVPETMVYFDDDPFKLGQPSERSNLVTRISNRVALEPRREILLLADRRIPHGDVMTVVNLARDAGVSRVNVTVKPD